MAAARAQPEPGGEDRNAGLQALAVALGTGLAPDEAEALLGYLDAMLVENESINLTGVRDPAAALVLHVLDSVALRLTGLRPAACFDLGSGNGFPGVAVRVLWPSARVVLCDRTGKKLGAVARALEAAGIERVETVHLDAAQVPAKAPGLRAAFDLVTARAVGEPAAVAALAAPLLAPGGHLLLWLTAADRAPERLRPGLTRAGVARYELRVPGEASRSRQLAWYRRSTSPHRASVARRPRP